MVKPSRVFQLLSMLNDAAGAVQHGAVAPLRSVPVSGPLIVIGAPGAPSRTVVSCSR